MTLTAFHAAFHALFLSFGPAPMLACTVCGGDPSADQVRAAKLGVLVLLGVVVALLASIAWVLRTWARRAAQLERAQAPGVETLRA